MLNGEIEVVLYSILWSLRTKEEKLVFLPSPSSLTSFMPININREFLHSSRLSQNLVIEVLIIWYFSQIYFS